MKKIRVLTSLPPDTMRKLRRRVRAAGVRLTDSERKVLEYRLGLLDGYSRTTQETGVWFGMSPDQVSQIEQKVFGKQSAPETRAGKEHMKLTALDYYHRANDRGRNGDERGALADLNRAIKVAPKMALAYFARGNIRRRRGNPNTAIKDYTVAIRLFPELSEAYLGRGKARRDIGDFAGSFSDYTNVLELGQDMLTKFVRGWTRPADDAHGRTKDFNRATIADLAMAIKVGRRRLNSQFTEAYFGRALARLGQKVGRINRSPAAS